jgi:iron complex transport system substrate-binding protein
MRSKLLILLLTLLLLSGGMLRAAGIRRIVSLAPSLTKNVQYLQAENLLAGCTSYCKTNRKVEVVASAVRVNLEKVVALKPDLVIATTITATETITTLRKFGIKVQVYPTARSFNEICDQFLDLGKQLGREKLARSIVERSRRQVKQLQHSAQTGKKPKLFLQIGANPLYTVFPNTFMDDYIRFAGAKNIASDLKAGTITRESVLLRNPDVIFIVTMGIVGEDEKKSWEKLKEISAAKNRKIFIIDSHKACTPTPITFVEMLKTIIHLTYGK